MGAPVEIIRGQAESGENGFNFIGFVPAVFCCGESEAAFFQHCCAGETDMLGEVADGIADGDAYYPIIRLLLAEYHAEESGFPVPVSADQPDALSGVDCEAHLIEYHLLSICFGHVTYLQHLLL